MAQVAKSTLLQQSSLSEASVMGWEIEKELRQNASLCLGGTLSLPL